MQKTNKTAASTTKIIYAIEPEKQPNWPCERPLKKVSALHAYNSKLTVKKAMKDLDPDAELRSFDFIQFKKGDTVIDVGMGVGRFLWDCRQMEPGLELIAVGGNLGKDSYISAADAVYYQFVPNHPHLLEDFSGKATWVWDTFGAGTYAPNPANALLYEVCLKSPDKRGCVSLMSSLVPGDKKYSAFGDRKTQAQLSKFFKEKMGVKVKIKPTYLESAVKPGLLVSDLLIKATRSGKDNKRFGVQEFEELSLELRDVIGVPVVKSSWKQEQFTINSYKYVPAEDDESTNPTDTEGSESVEITATDEMLRDAGPEAIIKSQYN